MLADIMTKAPPLVSYVRHREAMGLKAGYGPLHEGAC